MGDEFQGLTYLQVKGTGLANTCPVVETGEAGSKIPAKDYKLEKFCMEPTSFTVKEESAFKAGESEFTKTKLMTRLTYTLDGMTGSFKVGSDGSVAVQERDGLDYAPVTVQLPGGERVPFLFTLKEFTGKGNTSQFGGDFVVPSYRGSSFLDPKGRGGSTGYDNAVALPAKSDADELQKENQKNTAALKGSAVSTSPSTTRPPVKSPASSSPFNRPTPISVPRCRRMSRSPVSGMPTLPSRWAQDTLY